MQPIRHGEIEGNMASVTVTFNDTGVTSVLKTRPGSVCHFFDQFPVGDDDIQLRLDWSDIDHNGQPTLDADFINRATGKHRSIQGKRQDAHHTVSSPGGGRCYTWKFDGVSHEFSVTVKWLSSVSESTYLEDFCSAEVIRAADRNPKER